MQDTNNSNYLTDTNSNPKRSQALNPGARPFFPKHVLNPRARPFLPAGLRERIMRIYYLNVNSIYSNEKLALVNEAINENDPDIVILGETKIDDSVPHIDIPNYKTVARQDRDRNGGGLAILAKDHINTSDAKSVQVCRECQYGSIKVGDISIVGFYKNPDSGGGDVRNDINSKLINQIRKDINPNMKTVIGGDANLPRMSHNWSHLRMTSSEEMSIEDLWVELVIGENLTQHVQEATRTDKRSGTENTLDIVLTTENIEIMRVEVGSAGTQFDHYGVLASIWTDQDLTKPHTETKQEYYFRETPETWELFRQKLLYKELDKAMLEPGCPIDTKLDYLARTLTETYEEVHEKLPKKKMATGWQSKGLRNSLRRTRRFHNKIRRMLPGPDKERLKALIKVEHRSNNRWMKLDRHKFEKSLLEDKRRPNNIWSFMKKLKPTKSSMGPLRGANGVLVSDDESMATLFNEYLTNKFPPQNIRHVNWEGPEGRKDSDLTNITVTMSGVEKSIKKLKRKSAPGPDNVLPSMLKEAIHIISGPLTTLFNEIIQTTTVPSTFKVAKVVGIHKKGPRGEVGNYRPISLTSHIAKLWEEAVTTELVAHSDKNGYISRNQHGFRVGHGTDTATVSAWEKAAQLVQQHGGFNFWSLDMSSAFDVVPSGTLLEVLHSQGIKGKVGRVLQEWLTNRSQYAVCGSAKSAERPVTASVVQGSKIGPKLWLNFVQSLLDRIDGRVLYICYADDINLIFSILSESDRLYHQETLNIIDTWAAEFGMSFGAHKTKRVVHGTQLPCQLEFGGVSVAPSPTATILGIQISDREKGHWLPTVKERKSNAEKVTSQLRRLIKCRTKDVMTKLYHAYFAPQLFYGCETWYTPGEKCIEQMLKKAFNGYWRMQGKDIPTNILRPQAHCEAKMLNFMNRWHLDLLPMKFNEHFRLVTSVTRQASDRQIAKNSAKECPVMSTTFTRKITDLWNNLPLTVRQLDRHRFKKKVKSSYVSTQVDRINTKRAENAKIRAKKKLAKSKRKASQK